jgi:hypothetical protein
VEDRRATTAVRRHILGTLGVRFEGVKLEEIQKWRDMGALDEVTDIGQPRISWRWVCTEKIKVEWMLHAMDIECIFECSLDRELYMTPLKR